MDFELSARGHFTDFCETRLFLERHKLYLYTRRNASLTLSALEKNIFFIIIYYYYDGLLIIRQNIGYLLNPRRFHILLRWFIIGQNAGLPIGSQTIPHTSTGGNEELYTDWVGGKLGGTQIHKNYEKSQFKGHCMLNTTTMKSNWGQFDFQREWRPQSTGVSAGQSLKL